MGWLLLESKDGDRSRSRQVEIPAAGTVLCGRSGQADLVLPATAVSRRHAIFFHQGGRDWVRDAGSTNGTQVNGARVAEPIPLVDGDRVQVGIVELVYREYVAPSAATSPLRQRGASRPSPAAGPNGGLLSDTPRWRDVTLVGKGGMGEVYRARDRDLAMLVAIKRLRPRDGRSSDLLGRLHAREAALGRTIEHPNVVRVLEEGVFGGDPLLLLEWVDGQDLAARGESLTRLERLEVLRQTALGLAAAHRAGIVHADLKPANLLLCAGAADLQPREENLEILEDPAAEPTREIAGELAEEIARRIGLPERPVLDPLPFVGRDGELAYLAEIAAEVAGGGRRWVLLHGERGVGRHRLVEEARRMIAESGSAVRIGSPEEWGPPPEGFEGVWITPLPAFFPDDDALRIAAEAARASGEIRELYLKPFLRGQAIRLVERICHDAASARAFVDAIDRETASHPAQLAAALSAAFDRGSWRVSGSGYRVDPRALAVDERAVAESLIERCRSEEKGVRDLLSRLAPVRGGLDFEAIAEIVEFDAATLYYLLGHAERAGYLHREDERRLRIGNEILRRSLDHSLDETERRRRARRALPVLRERIESGRASTELHLGGADLALAEGRLEEAFRWAVRGALSARQRYERESFFAAVDGARECYRRAGQGSARRALQGAGEELLGPAGRGLDGLDRLRRLPTAVAVKITDFGIARRVEPEAAAVAAGEVPWGTPRYMSPEQARGEPLGVESDIFSLGIVARELLEGRHPLGDLRGRGAIRALLDGAAAPRAAATERVEPLAALLARMLLPDPAGRPSATEVADEVQRAQIRSSASNGDG